MDALQLEKMMKLTGKYITAEVYPTAKLRVKIFGELRYNGNDSWSVSVGGSSLNSVVFSSESVATIWEDDEKISLKV